ncbi:MAG: hypothetical protein A2039_08575 [Candidatus Melainabacteria bacterium GWA2_34_9]|nr:MAG: hypothetical protein A2039_08575 [Candidatus Melainabacteria bacterium GWA2_34_9]
MDVNNIYNQNAIPAAGMPTQPQSHFVVPVANPYIQQQLRPAYQPVNYQFVPMLKQQTVIQKSLLEQLIEANSTNAVSSAKPVQAPQTSENVNWKNDLRQVFKDNKAVIYAMIPRTFNAKDKNGDGLIDLDKGEETGNFLNDIERLDELKKYGINTIHMLPIHAPGKKQALGTAGSVYAPEDLLALDPILRDKNDPRDVKEQAKEFIRQCHKRGISVMIDLPSCVSVDMYEKRPELVAIDAKGFPKVPQGWQDIRMMEPWADEDKRILNKALVEEHKKWIDLIQEIGADGVRADVGRAKPVEFWDELIPYARKKDPNFAFLAESYVYEDASPMMNMPYDRPKDLLKVGFDSFYGQYHIFPHMEKAKDFHEYMKENLNMSKEFEPGKSLIGSFATHDDNSPMSNGGVPYCNMTTGIQMTLPMTNPYYVTGFESGDRYIYPYKNTIAEKSMTDNNIRHVNPQWVDIFNLSRKPGGENPEIGDYMSKMAEIRNNYADVITKGSYIPLEVENNKDDKIIAYARHYNGKTLLAVANKDVNSKQIGKIKIPGLKPMEDLKDLCTSYGILSGYSARKNAVEVNLGPARFHLFEIDTPNIEKDAKEVYKQNL